MVVVLPGAVGPDVAEQIALGQIQAEVIDGVQMAVDFGEVLGFDHGLGRGASNR